VNAVLRAGRYTLALDRPLLMGVVNVTPDSFSDGGRYLDPAQAIAHARRLVDEGADLLDIGGESTRPGAGELAAAEELDRVLPVIEAAAGLGRPVSVDTQKPEVMRAAIAAGAVMVNDVYALRAAGAIEAVAASEAAVCLMHMRGRPRDMQDAPSYVDAVAEVTAFLRERVEACRAAGIAAQRIVVDPGFGFGKNYQHNLALVRALTELARAGAPLLVGLSRKSMLGTITGRGATERLPASIAAALWCAGRGAAILRVHDVAATRDALAVWRAFEPS
jgi:dihydropteroate synthase